VLPRHRVVLGVFSLVVAGIGAVLVAAPAWPGPGGVRSSRRLRSVPLQYSASTAPMPGT